MALKDEARPIYLKIRESVILTTETGIKFIVGTYEFLTQADKESWEAGGKVYNNPGSYEVYLTNHPISPTNWVDTGEALNWAKMMGYQTLKTPEAIERYPELANLQGC